MCCEPKPSSVTFPLIASKLVLAGSVDAILTAAALPQALETMGTAFNDSGIMVVRLDTQRCIIDAPAEHAARDLEGHHTSGSNSGRNGSMAMV